MQLHEQQLYDLKAVRSLRAVILSDNYVRASSKNILGEHGFSVLLSNDQEHVLFDTGQTGKILVNNLGVMGFQSNIPAVVLSHGHYDHSGGLLAFIRRCYGTCSIYTHPAAFYRRFKKVKGKIKEIGMPFSRSELEEAGGKIHTSKAPQRVTEWLMTTGEIERKYPFEKPETEFYIESDGKMETDPFLDDQAVISRVEGKGLVVVTGCAHSGAVNTVKFAKKLVGEKVYAVIGGFHLMNASKKKLKKTVHTSGRLKKTTRLIPQKKATVRRPPGARRAAGPGATAARRSPQADPVCGFRIRVGDVVYLRYFDAVLFKDTLCASKPIIRETIGWLDYEDAECVRVVWERYAEPTINEESRVRVTGLAIRKSNIIEATRVS